MTTKKTGNDILAAFAHSQVSNANLANSFKEDIFVGAKMMFGSVETTSYAILYSHL